MGANALTSTVKGASGLLGLGGINLGSVGLSSVCLGGSRGRLRLLTLALATGGTSGSTSSGASGSTSSSSGRGTGRGSTRCGSRGSGSGISSCSALGDDDTVAEPACGGERGETEVAGGTARAFSPSGELDGELLRADVGRSLEERKSKPDILDG